jgi:hypothetical protein
MPHAFILFEKHPSTQRCHVELAKFAMEVTTNQPIETHMEMINGKGITEDKPLSLESYPIAFTKAEVFFKFSLLLMIARLQNGGRRHESTHQTKTRFSVICSQTQRFQYIYDKVLF